MFGEIAARPPGAHTVDLMNFVGDVDLFDGYAEAELHGPFLAGHDAQVQRRRTSSSARREVGASVASKGLESIMARLRRAHRAHRPACPWARSGETGSRRWCRTAT